MKTNKSGSLTINPKLDAYSYDWYKLGMMSGDVYLVNDYNYSSTTVRHYYKLMRFIEDKGLTIVRIEAPKGLQNLTACADHYKNLMTNCANEMSKPRKRETTKQRLMNELNELEKKYNFVIGLIQNEK